MDPAINKEESFADIYMQTASFQVPSILDYDHKMCNEETRQEVTHVKQLPVEAKILLFAGNTICRYEDKTQPL